MNFEELKNIFNNVEYFGEKLVVKQELARTITFIKENYHFDVLKNITAVDGGEEIELIYFLYNSEDDENLQISTTVKKEAESVSKIFDSAVADEKEIYDLLYKALNRISDSKDKKDALIAVIKFQLKILLIMGFCVELDTCLCCRERVLDEEMYFSSTMGGIICKECNEHLGVKLKMHHKIKEFLEAMLQFDFDYESEYDKKATEKVCQVCFNLLDEYIKIHTNKKTKTTKVLQELAM